MVNILTISAFTGDACFARDRGRFDGYGGIGARRGPLGVGDRNSDPSRERGGGVELRHRGRLRVPRTRAARAPEDSSGRTRDRAGADHRLGRIGDDVEDFVSISLVYLGIYALSTLSLNLQYGYAGIINFGWIVFQAVGAYVAAVTSLGPTISTGFSLHPRGAACFSAAPLFGTLAGAALALVLGVSFSPARSGRDFQAIIMLVVAIIAPRSSSQRRHIQWRQRSLRRPEAVQRRLSPFVSRIPVVLRGLDGGSLYRRLRRSGMVVSDFVGPIALRAIREDDALAGYAGINVQALARRRLRARRRDRGIQWSAARRVPRYLVP